MLEIKKKCSLNITLLSVQSPLVIVDLLIVESLVIVDTLSRQNTYFSMNFSRNSGFSRYSGQFASDGQIHYYDRRLYHRTNKLLTLFLLLL